MSDTGVTFPEINWLPKLAADHMAVHGWTQGAMEHGSAVCLTGALQAANHGRARPGDWLIAREVFRRRDRAETWNDAAGRTQDEVEAQLRDHPIVDADLEATFGPSWRQVVALVRRAATLTEDEVQRLSAAEAAAEVAADAAAWAAARAAARDAARADAGAAAGAAVEDATGDAAGAGAWAAAGAAAGALVARDLISPEYYQVLTGPWESVCGPVYLDDTSLGGS